MSWQNDYYERFYCRNSDWMDGTTEFHSLCKRHISEKSKVLEIGAGPSNKTSAFLLKISKLLVGLDVDEAVKENNSLSRAYVYDGKKFPFEDESFEAVVSNYVLEHVEEPAFLCHEISRVLVQGGVFVFRTPNIYHYVPMLSRCLPMWLSNWARNLPADAHDPYPTFYRFNSVDKCKHILHSTGFKVLEMSLVEKEPSYGMKSKFLFFPLLAYERIVNYTEKLDFLRSNIFCAARKV